MLDRKIVVKLVRTEGCPGGDIALERYREAAAGLEDKIEFADIIIGEDDVETAEKEHLYGSPTFLINGVDPFWDGEPGEEQEIALGCRPYINFITIEGKRKRKVEKSPTIDMLREAIQKAIEEVSR
jgi:hypothetical protein